MNISIITPNGFPEIGGDVVDMDMLSKGFANKGHNVKWICRHYNNTKDNEYLGKVKIERVRIPNIHYGRSFLFSLYAIRHVLKISKDSDVLQFNTFTGSLIDCIIKKVSKKPSVLLIRPLFGYWKDVTDRRLEKTFLSELDKVILKLPFDFFITPCEFMKNEMIKHMDEDKVKRIYWGIDHDVFYKKRVKKDDRFVIGFLGRMNCREKNVECLIKAFKIVKKNIEESVLFLVGSGSESLKEIPKDVHCLGNIPHDNLNEWYSSLDVFASASLVEGFGRPFIEAQACGTPVVCFNRTAMPEVVKHNVTGLLVNETTPKALANALIDFHNKKLKSKFSSKCMRWSKQFTWEKCIEGYLKVYKELIEKW